MKPTTYQCTGCGKRHARASKGESFSVVCAVCNVLALHLRVPEAPQPAVYVCELCSAWNVRSAPRGLEARLVCAHCLSKTPHKQAYVEGGVQAGKFPRKKCGR